MRIRRRFLQAGIAVLLTFLTILGVALLRLYVCEGLVGQAADSNDLALRLGFLGGAICLILSAILRRRFCRCRGGKRSA